MIRSGLVDLIHGVAVPDPFRRLEAADDPETIAWVSEQNARTRGLLDTPLRQGLVARLRELHRVPRISAAAVRGERIFYTENDGTRGQAVLYRALGAATPAQVLVDPNLIDTDGTTAITVFEPDGTGDRVVYGLSRHGSDVQELLVHDLATGARLADRLLWVKFASIAWWGEGFFYTRYPENEQYFCQVWFHRVGEPQSADRLIYHRPDAPEVTFEVKVTSDDRHLVIGSYQGASDHAEIHVLTLAARVRLTPDTTEIRPLVVGFTSGWHFIDGRDALLYFRTDADAPFGRIVRWDVSEAEPRARVIVPESRDTIADAAVANGRLLVSSLRNASSRLAAWPLEGGDEREIALPGIGTLTGLGAQWTGARSVATFASFTTPPAIMACDGDALVPIRDAALPFDPAEYVTEQVWYPSKDGTPISMFLVSRRPHEGRHEGRPEGLHYTGRRNDGVGDSHDDSDDRSAGLPASARVDDSRASARLAEAPEARRQQACLLTGYGGFNISLTPSFDPSDFLWLDAGGVLAVANLRGGGEYGDAWHRAGMREQKQNVFDDFIAAAEWLQTTGRAAPGRVAIEGGSNGGLLVGACVVQRPELFGAALCRVPVADMLRYHLFTVGRFWIPEYGCADDPADFPFLLRYSPYHNIVDGAAYPPTLVMTADTDDRVAPGMAKKFAARLQEASGGASGGPVLLRVETRAGHGAGKPVEKQIAEQADLYAFLFAHLTGTSASEQTRRQAER